MDFAKGEADFLEMRKVQLFIYSDNTAGILALHAAQSVILKTSTATRRSADGLAMLSHDCSG